MIENNILKCECCGVPWNTHGNVLQTCKKLEEMKNENQKLKEELKNLRQIMEMATNG